MSRIDDLVAEHCPEGVEFIELQDLFDIRGGYTPSKADSTAWTDGDVPWFRLDDIRASGRVLRDSLQHIHESAVKGGRLFPADSFLVATSATIGEHALVTVPHVANQRFTSLSLRPEHRDRFDVMFLHYYCFVLDAWCQGNTTTSNFATVDMAGFKKFKFPCPPLALQREIAVLIEKMERLGAELEAELEARTRQYSHCRAMILTAIETETVPLSDLGKWYGGVTPSKANPAYWDCGTIPWLASMDVSDTKTEGIRGRITQTALDETSLRLLPAPSVAVVMRSNILRRVLPIGLIQVDTTVNQDMRLLVPGEGVDAEYVYQALQAVSDRIREACVRLDGSMAAVDSRRFFAWEIPLPDLGEQRRIAAQLRYFDRLVNDLSSGLPAEIAARRKQYEYYRDRLLTFEEKTA